MLTHAIWATHDMTANRQLWRTEQVIPSDNGAGKRVLDEILGQLAAHEWSERDIFSVHLALEEALVNAIKHGNRCDVSKSVHVLCELSKDRLRVRIEDEGPGFNPDQVPDCTGADRLEMPCGRGVLLMRSFMNSVEFSDKGNCVEMTKCRQQGEDAA
ncbi:MAG: ATP-binding protein [Singulisphaera sp.]